MTDDKGTKKQELRERLTPEQYRVTQEAATERPFTGRYYKHDSKGTYRCVCCGSALFESDTKFESGSGWPSFWAPAATAAVASRKDTSLGHAREEVVCAECDAHLGHVFPDGPEPTGKRFCINSVALNFEGED